MDFEKGVMKLRIWKSKELGSKNVVSRNNIIKNKDGSILVEDEIKNTWEEYFNMLYGNIRGEILKFNGVSSGPPIMQE